MQALPRVLCSSDATPSATSPATTRAHGLGLLGCGTVGSGVARRLLASHPGLIRGIAVRDPHKPRDVAWDDFSNDAFDVVDDPSVRVVVECIGGLGLARELILRAIARGKDVVTANKDLIATEGPWLAAFAARTGASLRYEAAVGGAIPIVRALGGALAGEHVLEIGGVLNGTTNFILDAMETGAGYGEALEEAQRLGFAESDPRSDVDGHDAAHKLAILAGPRVSAAVRLAVARAPRDRRHLAGRRRGRRARAACGSSCSPSPAAPATAIEAGVTPAYVPEGHPFARARGAENVVRVLGRGCGAAGVFGCRRGRRRDGVGRRGRRPRRARIARARFPRTAARIWWCGRCAPPVLVRYADGSVTMGDAVSLDALDRSRCRACRPRGRVDHPGVERRRQLRHCD